MFTTCSKCRKQNDFWTSRSLKEPAILNGQKIHGGFVYSKYYCPISERKIRNGTPLDQQEKVLIIDCLNGDREEMREKNKSDILSDKTKKN